MSSREPKPLMSIEQARNQIASRMKTEWFKDAVPSGISCPDCGAELGIQVMGITGPSERDGRCLHCDWAGSVPLLECAVEAHHTWFHAR